MGCPALCRLGALLIFIGISRIVAEAGLAAVRALMIAPDLVMQGLGSTLVGSGSVFNMSLSLYMGQRYPHIYLGADGQRAQAN